jgi:hypothetical protein
VDFRSAQKLTNCFDPREVRCFLYELSRFVPLNGPRGAESGDHFQFTFSTEEVHNGCEDVGFRGVEVGMYLAVARGAEPDVNSRGCELEGVGGDADRPGEQLDILHSSAKQGVTKHPSVAIATYFE